MRRAIDPWCDASPSSSRRPARSMFRATQALGRPRRACAPGLVGAFAGPPARSRGRAGSRATPAKRPRSTDARRSRWVRAAVAAAAAMASSVEPSARMDAPRGRRPPRPPANPRRPPAGPPRPNRRTRAAPRPGTPRRAAKDPGDVEICQKKTPVPSRRISTLGTSPVAKSDSELSAARQLLSQRRVFLNTRVDDKSASARRRAFLDQGDPRGIVLYINSGGGVVSADSREVP